MYDKVKIRVKEQEPYDEFKLLCLRRFLTLHVLHTSARIPCHLPDFK